MTMLVKIGNKWLRADRITCLECSRGNVNGIIGYVLLAYSFRLEYLCGKYDTEEGAAKAMNELAEKINAAQGCKPAAEEKVAMKYEEHGDEAIVGVYRCSRCKTMIREEYSWYKFCPACGREIERWE